MSKTTDYRNRVFNPAGLALPSTEVGVEMRDNCRYFNPSYENLATTDPHDRHQYEDPAHVRNQILMGSNVTGPRRKRNEVYESTSDLSPLKRSSFPRTRHRDTECSEDSTTSTDVHFTRDSCFSRLILFLVLIVSITSLVLVILMMMGIVGQKCTGCSQNSKGEGSTAGIIGDDSLSNTESKLEAIINDLKKNVSNLQTSLISKDKRIDQLEARLSAQNTKVPNFHVATKLVELVSAVKALNATVKRLQEEKRQVVETLKSTDGYLNRTVRLLHDEDSKIDANLQNKLSAITMDMKALEQKFMNVSKMSGPRGFNGSIGPQGPAGSGDLSQCVHKEASSSSGSVSVDLHLTPDQNEVVMGMTCSSDVYNMKVFYNLRHDSLSNRYFCRCSTDEQGIFKCVMHYWSCPKIS